jgi:hypothetical protein
VTRLDLPQGDEPGQTGDVDPEPEQELLGREVEILGREPVRLERRRERRRDPELPRTRARGPRRRMPRWQKVTIVAAATVVAVAVYVDHRVGEHEATALAACDQELRSATHTYDTRMSAMYDYLRPALDVHTPGQGRMVSTLMSVPARQVLPAATAARDRCTAVHVLPWHASGLAHRAADLAYADALVSRLRSAAERLPGFRIDDRHLDRLRAAADIPPALGS